MKTLIILSLLVSTHMGLACGSDTECFSQASKQITQAIKLGKCLPEAREAMGSLENDLLAYNPEELTTCLIRAKEAQKFKASVARLKKRLETANVR